MAGGYEWAKAKLPPEHSTPTAKLAAAWAVGMVGSLTCFPVDTVKRRIMLDGSPGFDSTAAVERVKKRHTKISRAVTEKKYASTP